MTGNQDTCCLRNQISRCDMPCLHAWIGGKVPGTGRCTPAVHDTLPDAKVILSLRGSYQVECQDWHAEPFFLAIVGELLGRPTGPALSVCSWNLPVPWHGPLSLIRTRGLRISTPTLGYHGKRRQGLSPGELLPALPKDRLSAGGGSWEKRGLDS